MSKQPPEADARITIVISHDYDLCFADIIKKKNIVAVYEAVDKYNAKIYALYPSYHRKQQVRDVKKAMKVKGSEADDVFVKVDAILARANDQHLQLRHHVLSSNPYLSTRKRVRYAFDTSILEPFDRWYSSHKIGAKACLPIIYFMTVLYLILAWFILLGTCIADLITCRSCATHHINEAEVSYIINVLQQHSALDSDAMQVLMHAELSQLCRDMMRDMGQYSKVLLWSGSERIELSENGDSYEQDEYVILINPTSTHHDNSTAVLRMQDISAQV